MEAADIADAEADRLDHLRLDSVKRRVEIGLRHLEGFPAQPLRLVELAPEADERHIALVAYRLDDRADLLQKEGQIRLRAPDERGALRRRHSVEALNIDVGHVGSFLPGTGPRDHFDLRKISSPTSRSSAQTATSAMTTKTEETAARSGVMMERILL